MKPIVILHCLGVFCLSASAIPSAQETVHSRVKRWDLSCRLYEKICRGWCRVVGHSGGSCSRDNECVCSEEDLEKYVCSEEVGKATQSKLCAGWCQIFRGKQTGTCDTVARECMCVEQGLGFSHSKCVSDFVCRMYCQAVEKKATGRCQGDNNWDCVCVSAPIPSNSAIDVL